MLFRKLKIRTCVNSLFPSFSKKISGFRLNIKITPVFLCGAQLLAREIYLTLNCPILPQYLPPVSLHCTGLKPRTNGDGCRQECRLAATCSPGNLRFKILVWDCLNYPNNTKNFNLFDLIIK